MAGRRKGLTLDEQASDLASEFRSQNRQVPPTLTPLHNLTSSHAACNSTEAGTRSEFCGHGIQHSGSGNLTVGRDIIIGRVGSVTNSSADR